MNTICRDMDNLISTLNICCWRKFGKGKLPENIHNYYTKKYFAVKN